MSVNRMKQQEAEAEEFLKGLTEPKEGEVAQPEPGEPEPATEPEPEPQAPSIPEPKPQEEGAAELKAEIARLKTLLDDANSPTWRQRALTLQGKYEAEVPRLAAEIRELKEQINRPQIPDRTPLDDAFEDLVDDYGEKAARNIIAVAERLAQDRAERLIDERLAPYNEKLAQIETAQEQTAEDAFFTALTNLAPDWKQINGWSPDGITQDMRFGEFLSKQVPATDYTYDDLLKHHYGRGNARKVAEIFGIFKASTGKPEPAPDRTVNKAAEKYLEPNKTGRGTTPPSDTRKIYTQSEVDDFFDSRIKGTFRGTREEASKLETEYTQAMIEGRVK